MRELDALLIGFLDRVYPTLGDEDKSRFAALLELPDALVRGYLLGHERPADPGDARLIEAVRQSFRP